MREDPQTRRVEAMLSSVLLDAQGTAESLASATVTLLAGCPLPKTGGALLSQELRQNLQAEICRALQGNPLCNGAGFASYVTPEPDAQPYWTLEWWRQEGQAIQQVPLESNQAQRQQLDFRAFEWFDQPARRHLPVVQGPYVDYVCNGAYTITAAHPVLLGGHFAGVAAVDVLVATLDRLLMPALGALGAPALIVNRDDRIVMSTAPGWRAGMLWRSAATATRTEHGSAPLSLVILPGTQNQRHAGSPSARPPPLGRADATGP